MSSLQEQPVKVSFLGSIPNRRNYDLCSAYFRDLIFSVEPLSPQAQAPTRPLTASVTFDIRQTIDYTKAVFLKAFDRTDMKTAIDYSALVDGEQAVADAQVPLWLSRQLQAVYQEAQSPVKPEFIPRGGPSVSDAPALV